MTRIKPEASSKEPYGASSAKDETAVAVAWGHEARAKGCKGAHLILSDWEYIGEKHSDGGYMNLYDKNSWKLKGAKLIKVDGKKIKEDTYYRCIAGKIIEVDDNSIPVDES